MMSQLCGDACSATMLVANSGSVLYAVANPMAAPGAMSYRISIMAVPSLLPEWFAATSTLGGRSLVPWRAAIEAELALSDIAQILTPVPSIPVFCARSAPCSSTPAQVTEPMLVMGLARGANCSSGDADEFSAPSL